MWVEPGAFEPLECIYVTKYYGTLEIFKDIFFCILASWATWIDILKNTSLPQIYLLFIFSSMIDLEPPTLVQKVSLYRSHGEISGVVNLQACAISPLETLIPFQRLRTQSLCPSLPQENLLSLEREKLSPSFKRWRR